MQSFSFTLRLSLDSPNQSVACKLLASCGKVNSMNALTNGRRGSQSWEESHSRAREKVMEKRRGIEFQGSTDTAFCRLILEREGTSKIGVYRQVSSYVKSDCQVTAGSDSNNVSWQRGGADRRAVGVHESWIDSSDLTVGMEVAYAKDFTDEIDLIDG